jgi:hypothetical protein
MKQDEFFKIVGIVIVCFFIIYITMKMFQLQTNIIEGLTNSDGTISSSSSSSSSSGDTGNIDTYAAAIKSQLIKLQDEILISKNKKKYEDIIIDLDDYIGYLMLKQMLSMNLTDMKTRITDLESLNALKNSKDALNAAMVFLDKQ